jgi:hypothetical protein
MEKREFFTLAGLEDSYHSVGQTVARLYTDCANPAPSTETK